MINRRFDMFFGGNDSFMDFMGYRNTVIEDKIDECISAIIASDGEEVFVDSGDLTEYEMQYVKKEVERRLNG